jgi:hypothetical protein
MRCLLVATIALLSGVHVCLAQVSTMGSTAMGLPSTPGTIQSSPLSGPSPFSALTQAAPDTTLAPLPLASDPTIPGTAVTCATPVGQITPGTPTVQVTSVSPMAGTTGAASSIFAPTIPTVAPNPSTMAAESTAAPFVPLASLPATSFMSDLPGSTIPAPPPPTVPPLPSPSLAPVPVPAPLMVMSTPSTFMPGATTTALAPTMPPAAMAPTAALGSIPTPIAITTIGNISPTAPLGSSSSTVCSSTPGGPPTNAAALPLSTPEIPANPPPGTIQPEVAQLAGTSIDPTAAVMPTPNTSACAEGTTINLATPGTMAPANATGAAATPGVSPPGC